MIYLLDTNAVIALLNGKPPQVRRALIAATEGGNAVVLSSVVMHELWYGMAKSSRPTENTKALNGLLAAGFQCLSFDESDAKIAGRLRAALSGAGTPIGPYDVLIAAQALRHEATLVTANAREFARVPDLKWENWAA